MSGRVQLLVSALFFAALPAQPSREVSPAIQQEEAAHFRFLRDRQAEEFTPAIDGALVAFRNDAHDLVISASQTSSAADLLLDIDIGARNIRWQISDHDHQIARHRVSSMATRQDGAVAIIIQRQTLDGRVLTSVMVLHRQMDDQETDLPDYFGAMWDKVGEDIDGDGSQEFLVPDARFLGAFGPGGHTPSPPLVFALQHGRYVDASRDGSYIEHFRELQGLASEACENADGLMAPQVRAACYGTLAGFSARSGRWPAARHWLQQMNGDFSANALPPRANAARWDEAVAGLLEQWGYLPRDQAVRWWSDSWIDYSGEERSGEWPFEVQLLLYDLQACAHFSDEPAQHPDGTINEHVVDMLEQHCLRPDGQGEFIGVGDLRWEWLRGKYREDEPVRQLLENPAA